MFHKITKCLDQHHSALDNGIKTIFNLANNLKTHNLHGETNVTFGSFIFPKLNVYVVTRCCSLSFQSCCTLSTKWCENEIG